ncbi:hypothetical protein IV203_019437 [Nitzschia inconspicua]|uniref:Uncharacterized protein n=1 Tax=Nitzschia inconspicua TaxID=303405 RepID=A0A9K3LZ57_9STRA|nr:hypothetical protein IV203_019437 [Nitzschia inconspicua]
MRKEPLVASVFFTILFCFIFIAVSDGFQLTGLSPHPTCRNHALMTSSIKAIASEDLVQSKIEEMVDARSNGEAPLVPLTCGNSSSPSTKPLVDIPFSVFSFLSSNFSYLVSPRQQLSQIGFAVLTQIVLQDVHWKIVRLMLLMTIKLPIYCVSKRQRLRRQRVRLEASYQASPAPRGEGTLCEKVMTSREQESMRDIVLEELGHFLLGTYCLEW